MEIPNHVCVPEFIVRSVVLMEKLMAMDVLLDVMVLKLNVRGNVLAVI